MADHFPDLKPFPGEASDNERVAPAGNRPPLDEMMVAEFMDGLRAQDGLLPRIDQLVAAGGRAGACADDETAGKYGDFIRMARNAAQAVEAEREKHNRPILIAQRALKARADSLVEPLTRAVNLVRGHLDNFTAKKAREAEETRRRAEEQARVAQAAAEEEARRQAEATGEDPEEAAAAVEVAPVVVDEAVARGEFSRVGSRTEWKFEIQSVRQVPDRFLKSPKVVEALEKVIGQAIRSGEREIKGVRIWSEQKAAVR